MDILSFFGRFHPLVLHLPIGFLVLGFLMEWMNRRNPAARLGPAVGIAIKWGMWSALVAAASGYLLSLDGGYEVQLLNKHQWLGIVTAILSVVLAFIYRRKDRVEGLRKLFFPAFAVTIGVLTITGHLGGSLTHGSDFLTEPLYPRPERRVITDLASAAVFGDLVQPIINEKCKSCHNPSKMKGDLLLSSVEGIKKGGSTGPLFVAGDPDNSLLVQRIHLPLEDEDHMPPEGKRQLSKDEKQLLMWWISEGAPFDARVAEVNLPNEVRTTLEKLVQPEQGIYALDVPPAKEEDLQKLKAAGLPVYLVAQEKPWLEVNLAGQEITSGTLQALQTIAGQMISLDLSQSKLSDEDLKSVQDFPHLTKLFLQNTLITDNGLGHLQNLEYLEYLNLYQTGVSDNGILQLAGLKNLKQLFLWQTKVTEAGATQLKAQLPGLEINLGADTTVFSSLQADTQRGSGTE